MTKTESLEEYNKLAKYCKSNLEKTVLYMYMIEGASASVISKEIGYSDRYVLKMLRDLGADTSRVYYSEKKKKEQLEAKEDQNKKAKESAEEKAEKRKIANEKRKATKAAKEEEMIKKSKDKPYAYLGNKKVLYNNEVYEIMSKRQLKEALMKEHKIK